MSSIDMVARAKWAAWDRLRGTAAAKAMRDYVLAVDREISATTVSTSKPHRGSRSWHDGLAGLGDDSDDGLAGLGDPDEADVVSAAVGTIGGPGSVSRMRTAADEEGSALHEGSGTHLRLTRGLPKSGRAGQRGLFSGLELPLTAPHSRQRRRPEIEAVARE